MTSSSRRGTPAQRILTVWARTAVGAFYRSVEVEAPWGAPGEGPVLLAANHSNALGDVAVLVAEMPRFPHFLAAATWWRHAPVRLLFRLGGVLPVQRARDGDGAGRNQATFESCAAALAGGLHLAVFPEGELNLAPAPLPLKTGAARIALAAGAGGVQGVEIVPVGLTYEDRGRFRSAASVRFGQPIRIDHHLAAYQEDPVDTVRQVTALLQQRLDDAVASRTAPEAGAEARATRRRAWEAVVLSPAAALGLAAWAPALAGVALLARAVPGEGWQATVKGVGGTVLLPVGWGIEAAVLRRHLGTARAGLLVAAGALSGRAALAWLDRVRRPPTPVRPQAQAVVSPSRTSASRCTISTERPSSSTSAIDSSSPVRSDSSTPATVRR
jgi:1-acyl-sn-glycerol-3-phosphate acyltransferase